MPFAVGKWNIRDDGVMEMKNVVFPTWEGVSNHIPRLTEATEYEVMGYNTIMGYINVSSYPGGGWAIAKFEEDEKGMYLVGCVHDTRVETATIVPSWCDVKSHIIENAFGPYASDEEIEVFGEKIGNGQGEDVKTLCTVDGHLRPYYWFTFKL